MRFPSFLLLNARSLVPKLDELNAIATAHRPSVIIVTESWLNEEISSNQILLTDYACPYRQDRNDKKGGGVCVYVSSDVHKSVLISTSINILPFESLWIDIPECKIFLFAAYIPRNLPRDIVDLIVTRIIEEADQLIKQFPNYHLILTGDFNQTPTQDIEHELNLKQVVTEATRGNAILDKILMDVSLIDSFHVPSVGPNLGKSDHRTIMIHPHSKISKIVKVKHLYDLRESNILKVKKALAAVPWQVFYRLEASIEEKCELFHGILTTALSLIPCEEVVITQNDKPWITPLIISLINKRYVAFRARNFRLYEHFKMKVKVEIRKAKQNWVQRVNDRKGNPWKIINAFRNKHHSNQLIDIINSFTTPSDAANAINNSLAEHFVQSTEGVTVPESNDGNWNVSINTQMVYNILRKLERKKSAGSDNISPRLIVSLADVITGPLTHLFCLSIESSCMPLKWKLANICPIPKKAHPKIEDLRPISMLPIFSKVLEKIVLSSVKKPLIDLYGSNQFGFRPHSSTLHAHICLHNFITESLESNSVDAIMLVSTDLRRAFDTLCVNKLLISLGKGQLPHSFLHWCKSFLEHRSQRVVLDESTISQTVKVTSGVPQGSVLSPYLFAAHMGSLKSTIPNSEMFKYADDVITAIPVQKTSNVDDLIRQQLHDINQWCNENGLMLNREKTKVMTIVKKGLTILPSEKCHMNYVCQELKFLGVFYNSKLNWTTHVTHICKKARRNVYILKQLKRFANKRCLIIAYVSLVLSILEYCGPLFLGIDISNARRLEKIRKRAHYIICGKDCDCPFFEKLDDRRKKQSLKLLTSMSNNDNVLHNLYPRKLRTPNLLALPHCSTKRRLTSFIPQSIILSNKH